MADNWLRYDSMVEQALRGVVRKALAEATQRGLPGDHHFYVTFHTDRAGVSMADWLRQQYPQEMTIVLQHQFWDLKVDDERFAVTLSFGGRHERLTVPLSAVTAFADPSVKFGLQFESGDEESKKRPQAGASAVKSGPQAATPPAAKSSENEDSTKGADVVTLDSFRKK